jgi:hypothetical protein
MNRLIVKPIPHNSFRQFRQLQQAGQQDHSEYTDLLADEQSEDDSHRNPAGKFLHAHSVE